MLAAVIALGIAALPPNGLYNPLNTTLLWIHVPKSGGTALAHLAHQAALHHRVKIAWCYNHHGQPACSMPKGTLAAHHALQHASFGSFLPENVSQPTAAANSAELPLHSFYRDRHPSPAMVFGHGVRFGCGARWGLPARHMHVLMIRHPLTRFFSAYSQAQRSKAAVAFGWPVERFAESCVSTGDMPGGPLEHFVVGCDNDDSAKANKTLVERFHNAARGLLDNSTVVLIYERWGESVELLERLGILPSPKKGRGGRKNARFNESPFKGKKLHLQSGDVKTVTKCISFEDRLYHLALTKFEEMLGQARVLATPGKS